MTFADSRKHSSSQLQNSTLSQLQGNVVVPSTLSMKERTNLRRNDPYEYGRWVNSKQQQELTCDVQLVQSGLLSQLKSTAV